MTPQMYQLLRPFALQHTWNRTKDELCENSRNPEVYAKNLLQKLRILDAALGTSQHRHNITLEVDVNVREREYEWTEKVPKWLRTLRELTRKPAQIAQSENVYVADADSTYHSWQWNVTHFAIKYTKTGLEILGSVVHEGEHADQSDTSLHSDPEQKLILLNRMLYTQPEQDMVAYHVNYNEMRARMQEAKLYIELFEYMQSDPLWNIAERQEFWRACKELNQNLMADVSEKSINNITNWLVKSLRHIDQDCQYFHEVFKGATPRERNQSAADFLNDEGRKLHLALFEEMKQLSTQLSRINNQLSKEVSFEHKDTTELQDHRRRVIRECNDANIPLVQVDKLVPYPQCMIVVDDINTSIQQAIEQAQTYYNSALTITSQGLCIVYDTEPLLRPYSTIPIDKLPDDPELSYAPPSYTQYIDAIVHSEDEHDEP